MVNRSPSSRETLLKVVSDVRQRWRLKIALRGIAFVVGGGLLLTVISSWGLDTFRFGPAAVAAFRLVTWGALAALGWWYLWRPLTRRVSDQQVALYLEEHEPSLNGLVMSAVESDTPSATELSTALLTRVVESAVARCTEIEYGRRIERPGLYRSSGIVAGATVAALVAGLLSPAFLRHGASVLFFPWSRTSAADIYGISVTPGNAKLARGADQKIGAQLAGFDAGDVTLSVKTGNEGKWERLPMVRDDSTAEFSVLLLDLDDRTEYFVEASGVRSPLYHIDVADLPYAKQIDLEYRYPAYTGLAPEKVENGGDIAAVRGTNVILRVTPTIPSAAGHIRVEDGAAVPLTAGPDGVLTGTLAVDKPGFYKIELQGPDGPVLASPDYNIDVLTDMPPSIRFTKPGRDSRATPIEEVFTEVQAEDDYGVRKLELVYSVNGAPDTTLVLYDGGRKTLKDAVSGHTFFLEEWKLQPGDFVSYFARATDARPGTAQSRTTDIYFLQVTPFGRDYRAAENRGGGGGGGGGGGEDGALSQRQREIIAATFKVTRDREQFTEREYRENIATVKLAEEGLRAQVEQLAQRMRNRGVTEMDSGFKRIGDALPLAVVEMEKAEEELGRRAPKDALPPEQRALKHLQRAEAVFRDVQVQMGGQQGGGGGGGGQFPNAEDLADLFELELDKLQNQYETVQRGERMRSDNQMDETLQRLRELARRQEQENERQRALAGNQRAAGSSNNQRQLAQETEELARQLERLAREQSNPDLENTAQQLRTATESMRRNATSGQSGQAGSGRAALDRLEEARRLLDRNRTDRLTRDAQDAMRQAEQLAEQQKRIEEGVKELKPMGQNPPDKMVQLLQRKDQLAAGVQALESQLDRMARDAGRERKDAYRKLDDAATSIRDNKIKEKIRFSKSVIQGRTPDYAREFEGEISGNIEELKQKIADASRETAGEGTEDQTENALRQARDLARGMQGLDERMRQAAEARRQQRLGQRGQPGEQGQPGQAGQQGQAGEQGQQGQGAQQGQGGENGRRGGNRAGGQVGPDGGRFGGWGGGNWSDDEIRQYSRELDQRQRDAEQLRQQLQRGGVDTRDLGRLIDQLRELRKATLSQDGVVFQQLQQQVVEGLKQFEYGLRRKLEGGDREIFLSGSEDVPPGYRQMVEEYYRSLSRTTGSDKKQ